MADFNKLKDTIRGAIYPNGRGAISADKHQAALLDMADTMQETDTKVTELSFEYGAIGSKGEEITNQYVSRSNYIPCKLGDVITAYIYRVKKYDASLNYLGEDGTTFSGYTEVSYEIADESCAYVRIVVYNEYRNTITINNNNVSFESDKLLLRQLPTIGKLKTEVQDISDNIGELKLLDAPITIELPGIRYKEVAFPLTLKKGMIIASLDSNIAEVGGQIRFKRIDGTFDTLQTQNPPPYLLGHDYVAMDTTTNIVGSFVVKGAIYNGLECVNEVKKEIQVLNSVTLPYSTYGVNILTTPIKKGTIITSVEGEERFFYAKKTKESPSIELFLGNLPYEIDDDYEVLYPVKNSVGSITIGKAYNERISEIDNTLAELTLPKEGKEILLSGKKYLEVKFPFLLKKGMIIASLDSNIAEVGGQIRFKRIDGTFDTLQTQNPPPYLLGHDYVAMDTTTNIVGSFVVKGGAGSLNNEPYIAIPIPKLAIVNIVADYLPTTKTDNIRAKIEFNDMQGNSFVKNVIANKQGNSTLALKKGNFSIDVMDENYDDSHEIKFGNWVAQDGFHLKSYYWDGIKVKALAAYDFYENILLSRTCRSNRQWKRMQLPNDIPITGNDINDLYLRIDDGAKCHPSGFPIILYHNGVFFGIYCWQLKKHRKNYHQKKDKAGHIHLDGNISAPLLWEANGNIDWDKWAGKEYESADSNNKDGIEIRNPKKLILVDGSEYDGETNAGELISASSPNYNPNNADMVRTASVRASIETFSRNATEIINMPKGAARKAKIAEVFDVDSVIDKILFGQVIGDRDGYKKNWQWFTYNGVKWAVAAYDLDGCWGWDSWHYFKPFNSLFDYESPIIRPIAEEYAEELRERYKYLRDTGVISVSAIMKPLVQYVHTIGNEYYELEDERWPNGVKDNLWRFETWIEESIKLQDAWLGYTSNLIA